MERPALNASIVTFVVALSGCLEGSPDRTATPTVEPLVPATSTETVELRVTTRYSATAGDVRIGDADAVAYEDVPKTATNVTLRVTWAGGVATDERQHCMLHDGTGRKIGAMLASNQGPAPLTIGPTNLMQGVETIGVMCWVDGTAAVGAMRENSVTATFGVSRAAN